MKEFKANGAVLTLDAGGTTFSFSSVDSSRWPSEPVVLEAETKNLKRCIDMIIEGFEILKGDIQNDVISISFAFPGPADYPNGVIGNLANLPAFKRGVPLGRILNDHFKVPVYINNDANLFALGEFDSGLLPEINKKLSERGSKKKYCNLLGVTLGTGFGGGIVIDDKLLVGDNSAAGEIWLMRHKFNNHINAEEGVSIRSVRNRYSELTGIDIRDVPSPLEISSIAEGKIKGDKEAAKSSFFYLGEVLGDAIANAVTLLDGAVVIGGGLSGASHHFMPYLINELNGTINNFPRLESRAYNLEDREDSELFYKCVQGWWEHPLYDKKFRYEKIKKIPVGISRLGAGKAVAIGAYRFAVKHMVNTY